MLRFCEDADALQEDVQRALNSRAQSDGANPNDPSVSLTLALARKLQIKGGTGASRPRALTASVVDTSVGLPLAIASQGGGGTKPDTSGSRLMRPSHSSNDIRGQLEGSGSPSAEDISDRLLERWPADVLRALVHPALLDRSSSSCNAVGSGFSREVQKEAAGDEESVIKKDSGAAIRGSPAFYHRISSTALPGDGEEEGPDRQSSPPVSSVHSSSSSVPPKEEREGQEGAPANTVSASPPAVTPARSQSPACPNERRSPTPAVACHSIFGTGPHALIRGEPAEAGVVPSPAGKRRDERGQLYLWSAAFGVPRPDKDASSVSADCFLLGEQLGRIDREGITVEDCRDRVKGGGDEHEAGASTSAAGGGARVVRTSATLHRAVDECTERERKERACFDVIAVADGVGEWEDLGLDPSRFSTELCRSLVKTSCICTRTPSSSSRSGSAGADSIPKPFSPSSSDGLRGAVVGAAIRTADQVLSALGGRSRSSSKSQHGLGCPGETSESAGVLAKTLVTHAASSVTSGKIFGSSTLCLAVLRNKESMPGSGSARGGGRRRPFLWNNLGVANLGDSSAFVLRRQPVTGGCGVAAMRRCMSEKAASFVGKEGKDERWREEGEAEDIRSRSKSESKEDLSPAATAGAGAACGVLRRMSSPSVAGEGEKEREKDWFGGIFGSGGSSTSWGGAKRSFVLRTQEQQHRWNCPFQFANIPKPKHWPELLSWGKDRLVRMLRQSLMQQRQREQKEAAAKRRGILASAGVAGGSSSSSGMEGDRPERCQTYETRVDEGDLVVLCSDGVTDNLWDFEIEALLSLAVSPREALVAFGDESMATPPSMIAKALTIAALHRSLDPRACTPFLHRMPDEIRQQCGYVVRQDIVEGEETGGGKPDDITVVAAWVHGG
uniref:PPM-type phosphatase domain-containing protein n=1 Tax=Chromera velia CCMP2878 TaxID=1169474 RepID=A0A0G4I0U6_9ALVE|eukprot:Cvel_10031.t1-p1 / transcript=Cvel_10031.t1 / gene=Cvel_10031 / organism=Chromera_velia_CCMP2878 / gene_product=hypothetical protein / transcript_product=hypothetical protein / location=Cvel_scaffold596:35077-39856(+) / protein_length=897 / sequence_SO=supercontig / SO=protein_coding / is_pseudo=false